MSHMRGACRIHECQSCFGPALIGVDPHFEACICRSLKATAEPLETHQNSEDRTKSEEDTYRRCKETKGLSRTPHHLTAYWTCTASLLVVLEMGTIGTSRLEMNDSSEDSDCLIANCPGVNDSGEEGGAQRLGRSHAGVVRAEPGLQPAQSAVQTYDGGAAASFEQ